MWRSLEEGREDIGAKKEILKGTQVRKLALKGGRDISSYKSSEKVLV